MAELPDGRKEFILLPKEDQVAFVEAVLNPPPMNPALARAMASSIALFGEDPGS